MKILIINGPNLNLLGSREPEIYGESSFSDYLVALKLKFEAIEIEYYQSNSESSIIEKIQQAHGFQGILINPGAYTHTSLAIADAIKAIEIPVVEIHLTNIYARESFRRHSYTSEACMGVMAGFGLFSYDLGIESILKTANLPKNT